MKQTKFNPNHFFLKRYGVCCAQSILHPEYKEGEGECEGFVRGELVETGMVIKDVGAYDDKKCTMIYMVCVNPRGWIPAMVRNLIFFFLQKY